MQKEVLTISEKKVTVEYEFLNDTDKDITTEVAFPVPPYSVSEYESAAGMRMFDDFQLWVNGKLVKYEIEAKAYIGSQDITGILNKYHVDVATVGHMDSNHEYLDIDRLPKKQQAELKKLGIPSNAPQSIGWSVHKLYHWQQTFPANSVLHVRHEYSPAVGFSYLNAELFTENGQAKALATAKAELAKDKTYLNIVKGLEDEIANNNNACVEPALQQRIISAVTKGGSITIDQAAGDALPGAWVDFILTTANSWKTPIKEFDLIVVKDAPKRMVQPNVVSFCWDGPVKRLDANHFEATAADFVPKKELHILYLDIPSK